MGLDMNDAGEAVIGTVMPARNRGMPGGRWKEAGIAKVRLFVELGQFHGQIGYVCAYPGLRGSYMAWVRQLGALTGTLRMEGCRGDSSPAAPPIGQPNNH